jgi:hypothetical protein
MEEWRDKGTNRSRFDKRQVEVGTRVDEGRVHAGCRELMSFEIAVRPEYVGVPYTIVVLSRPLVLSNTAQRYYQLSAKDAVDFYVPQANNPLELFTPSS